MVSSSSVLRCTFKTWNGSFPPGDVFFDLGEDLDFLEGVCGWDEDAFWRALLVECGVVVEVLSFPLSLLVWARFRLAIWKMSENQIDQYCKLRYTFIKWKHSEELSKGYGGMIEYILAFIASKTSMKGSLCIQMKEPLQRNKCVGVRILFIHSMGWLERLWDNHKGIWKTFTKRESRQRHV